MPYNFVADNFPTKKLYSRLSSSNLRFSLQKKRPFAFLSPCTFEGLEAMYDVHLRLIRKRLIDFLSVFIELFPRCYR